MPRFIRKKPEAATVGDGIRGVSTVFRFLNDLSPLKLKKILQDWTEKKSSQSKFFKYDEFGLNLLRLIQVLLHEGPLPNVECDLDGQEHDLFALVCDRFIYKKISDEENEQKALSILSSRLNEGTRDIEKGCFKTRAAFEKLVFDFELSHFYIESTFKLNDEVHRLYSDLVRVFLKGWCDKNLPSQSPFEIETVKAEDFYCGWSQLDGNDPLRRKVVMWVYKFARFLTQIMTSDQSIVRNLPVPMDKANVINVLYENINAMYQFTIDTDIEAFVSRSLIHIISTFDIYKAIPPREKRMCTLPDGFNVVDSIIKVDKMSSDDARVSFLLGKYLRHKATTKDDILKAVNLYERSVELCPNYHIAYHHLSLSHKDMWFIDRDYPQAQKFRSFRVQKKYSKWQKGGRRPRHDSSESPSSFHRPGNNEQNYMDREHGRNMTEHDVCASDSRRHPSAVYPTRKTSMDEAYNSGGNLPREFYSARPSQETYHGGSANQKTDVRETSSGYESIAEASSVPCRLSVNSSQASPAHLNESPTGAQNLADKIENLASDLSRLSCNNIVQPSYPRDPMLNEIPEHYVKPEYFASLKAENQIETEDPDNEHLRKSYEYCKKACDTSERISTLYLTDLARICISLGRNEEARQTFEQAFKADEIGKDFSSSYLYEQSGLFQMQFGDLRLAKIHLRKSVELSIERKLRSNVAFYKLLELLNSAEESIAVVKEKTYLYKLVQDFSNAKRVIQNNLLFVIQNNDSYDTLWDLVDCYVAEGDYDSAMVYLSMFITARRGIPPCQVKARQAMRIALQQANNKQFAAVFRWVFMDSSVANSSEVSDSEDDVLEDYDILLLSEKSDEMITRLHECFESYKLTVFISEDLCILGSKWKSLAWIFKNLECFGICMTDRDCSANPLANMEELAENIVERKQLECFIPFTRQTSSQSALRVNPEMSYKELMQAIVERALETKFKENNSVHGGGDNI